MSGARMPNTVWSRLYANTSPARMISGNSAWLPLISWKKRRGVRGTWNGKPRTVNHTFGGCLGGRGAFASVTVTLMRLRPLPCGCASLWQRLQRLDLGRAEGLLGVCVGLRHAGVGEQARHA